MTGIAVWLVAPLLASAACGAAVAVAVARRRADAVAEMVARAAHELRGPLAAAHLAVQAAARETPGMRGRLAGVDVQLQRAALAVADLATAPDGRGGLDSRAPVDVAEMLENQLRAWAPMAAAHGCDLVLEPAPRGLGVDGDAIRLSQALGNVVANAIEHGRGPIRLRARSVGDRVLIEVHDGGPGLPGPIAELVTRPRRGRGTRGRGLAIAMEIARRHGGRLAVASGEDGTRLALDLPARCPAAARP